MKNIPIIPKGDALDVFGDYQDSCSTFLDGSGMLRKLYLSSQERAGTIYQWETTSLSMGMAKLRND